MYDFYCSTTEQLRYFITFGYLLTFLLDSFSCAYRISFFARIFFLLYTLILFAFVNWTKINLCQKKRFHVYNYHMQSVKYVYSSTMLSRKDIIIQSTCIGIYLFLARKETNQPIVCLANRIWKWLLAWLRSKNFCDLSLCLIGRFVVCRNFFL